MLPPLTPQDRAKFVGIFWSSGPEGGVLDGMHICAPLERYRHEEADVWTAQRARAVLLKSRLPMGTLGQIWCVSSLSFPAL